MQGILALDDKTLVPVDDPTRVRRERVSLYESKGEEIRDGWKKCPK